MEILEIISYNVNFKSNILDVSFRTIDDAEDVQRTDRIDYSLVEEYGYDLVSQDFDVFEEIDEDDDENYYDFIDDQDVDLDEEELMSFLNEYYMVNQIMNPSLQFLSLVIPNAERIFDEFKIKIENEKQGRTNILDYCMKSF